MGYGTGERAPLLDKEGTYGATYDDEIADGTGCIGYTDYEAEVASYAGFVGAGDGVGDNWYRCPGDTW